MLRSFVYFYMIIVLFTHCTAGDSAKEQPEQPISVTAFIQAAEGGSVTLEDGARVDIPAGALSRDAEVTLARVACGQVLKAAEFASCAYEVSTEVDVTLAARYRLTLPEQTPESTPYCMLAMTDEGWRCQTQSEPEQNAMTTSASRFNTFVLHKQVQATVAMNLMTDLTFSDCGGDLFGEWELAFFVGPEEALTSIMPPPWNSDFDVCEPFAHYTGNIAHAQETITITPAPGGNPEAATYANNHYHEGYELHVTTEACLAAAGLECETQTPWCEQVDGLCICRLPFEGAWSDGQSLYAVEGGYSFQEGGAPLDYCVLGDTLTRHVVDGDRDAFWVYLRK